MRTNIKFLQLLTIICSLFIILGCQNFNEPDAVQNETMGPAEGCGYLFLNIGGENAGRTILPVTIEQDDFAAYTFVFSSTGITDITVNCTNSSLSSPIELPAAVWNLFVTAYTDGAKTKPAAKGELAGIVISSGENTSKSLELYAITEEGATGTFSWDIEYPADVTSAYMTIISHNNPENTEKYFFAGGATNKAKIDSIELNTGYYKVVFSLTDGTNRTGLEEYLHVYRNMESFFTIDFTAYLTAQSVINGNDSGPGSLRQAVMDFMPGSVIFIEDAVKTIILESRLEINKNLIIDGNGVTITRSGTWTESNTSQLLTVTSAATATIRRVHFKDGRVENWGAAIYNQGDLTLKSCIFSGNNTNSLNTWGGAIFNTADLKVLGCTFYNNSSANAAAIYTRGGELSLAGNLFYGNTAGGAGPVVYHLTDTGTVTSLGYNLSDATLVTLSSGSWTGAQTSDKIISSFPISPFNFKLLSPSPAANTVTTLPAGYPTEDFYGNEIKTNAAAGAVQAAVSGSGIVLDVIFDGSLGDVTGLTQSPDSDGLYSSPATLTAAPVKEDYSFGYWLVNGQKINGNVLSNINSHSLVRAVFIKQVLIESSANSGSGSLRAALESAAIAPAESVIAIDSSVKIIALESRLTINRNLTIEGNGVTITRVGGWTAIDDASQLLRVESAGTATISRVHFKDGKSNDNGAAIFNEGDLTLKSCVFSGNRATHNNLVPTEGGAIGNYSNGILNVFGCTFYNNYSYTNGGAILTRGSLTLAGNLFYGNTAGSSGPVVYRSVGGTVTSLGYNLSDATLVTAQSGSWTGQTSDKISSGFPMTPDTFKLVYQSEAAEIVKSLPANYPSKDFYGNNISVNAAAGAVQSSVNGYYLGLSSNDSAMGSAVASPPPDADGIIAPGAVVTITPVPASTDYGLVRWELNGQIKYDDPLTLTMNSNYLIKAVFRKEVRIRTADDDGPGSLREALGSTAIAPAGSVIVIDHSVKTITLLSRLEIKRNLTIEGNGVTITRAGGWTAINNASQLLQVESTTAIIRRIHFKDGKSTDYGGAIYGSSAKLTLESCIFSGNSASSNTSWGGAVCNYGNNGAVLKVLGCTFYGNSGGYGGAIYNYSYSGNSVTLAGNLFYGNTAKTSGPIVYGGGSISSLGYNVCDIPIGNDNNMKSGFAAAYGDIAASGLPIAPNTLRPLKGTEAVNRITAFPAGYDYPETDFEGVEIELPAAAGAIQTTPGGNGFYFDLTYDSAAGSINGIPSLDGESHCNSGPVNLSVGTVNSGYRFEYWLVNGEKIKGNSINISTHSVVKAVFMEVVEIKNENDSGTGSLRAALEIAPAGSVIVFASTVKTITLEGSSRLVIDREMTIDGNGVTITRSGTWTPYTDTQLLRITSAVSGDAMVTIRAVHFKNGSATQYGGAIDNRGNLTLESCIFNGNQTYPGIYGGGAIYSAGTLKIMGCTFYNNSSASQGWAIYNNSGRLTLAGNLFYYNKALSVGGSGYIVRRGGTVESLGYNVCDVAYGTSSGETGWASVTGDITINSLPISPITFKLLSGSAAGIIPAPALTDLQNNNGYPEKDFYGADINANAAAGAVQATASGSGFCLDLIHDSAAGSINGIPSLDGDGLCSSGPFTLSVGTVNTGYRFRYWLVNGVKIESNSINISSHSIVQSVFMKVVTVTSENDSVPGSLREALLNAPAGSTIDFASTVKTITLTGSTRLSINRELTIEGNGVTITRDTGAWTRSTTSQLLTVTSDVSTTVTVTISGIHFKNGLASAFGAAIDNRGNLTLESCIFSDNQVINTGETSGGAIYSESSIKVIGCTFYGNDAGNGRGGAIYITSLNTVLTIGGNLFYGNTARSSGGPVVYVESASVTSLGYNVCDVAIGTGGTLTGWASGKPGDKTFTELSISGDPFNTTTFVPVGALQNHIPTAPADFPVTDFNGAARTWPGAPGAVK